jgi:transcriptional regulator GlxA family with amidase domain
MRAKPLHVSLVVFPECDPSILYGIYDTLWAAGRFWETLKGGPPGEPLFEPRIVGAQAGPLQLVTGVSIIVQDSVDSVQDTDIVIIPNVIVSKAESLRELDRRLLEWIKAAYRSGSYIYSSCGGSLALAEAGLLDGLEATTHWGYADLFRREFPNVTVHANRILVQSGPGQRVVCSGGASSWQDLVLFLVARHVGSEEAIRLSKIFLYQWHRDGQLPYASMVQNVLHDDPLVQKLQVWISENYSGPNAVSELVQMSGLPERTFTRRFKSATGYAPIAYIQALRIEEAKHALETGNDTVEQIAHDVGYQDTAYFRRLFARLTGMTPANYRRQFQLPMHLGERMNGKPRIRETAKMKAAARASAET